MRANLFLSVIVVVAGIFALGFIYDLAWITGLAMLAVGAAFALALWSSPAIDPEEPRYGTPEAAAAWARAHPKRTLVESPLEGVGVMSVIVVGAGIFALGFIYDVAWITGLAMLAVGGVFAVAFWLHPKARA